MTGPITVVSGKHRRLTFIECVNDLNAMIDIAKIADLVLLLIDGNFGFEMETMEFLNILAPHGMPKVMGVLTHLDLFKKPATLRAAKKRLKQRFWTEIYQGAKLFYLSGVINGRYPDREVLNLARFISVMKFRPLIWRNSHPYLLADRVEDLTSPQKILEEPNCNRTITLYGYCRGTNFPASSAHVHLPGVADLIVSDVSSLPDPCPAPGATNSKKRKSISEKQKLIYGPMSDVGGIMFDKDAVYIDMPTNSFSKRERDVDGENESTDEEAKGLGERLVIGLQGVQNSERSSESLQLFSHGENVFQKDFASDADMGRKFLRNPKSHSTDQNWHHNGTDLAQDDKYLGSGELVESEVIDERYAGSSLQARTSRDNVAEAYEYAESDSDFGESSGGGSRSGVNNTDHSDSDVEGEDNIHSSHEPSISWKTDLIRKTQRKLRAVDRPSLSSLIYDETLAIAQVVQRWCAQCSVGDSLLSNGNPAEVSDEFFDLKQVAQLEIHGRPSVTKERLANSAVLRWDDSTKFEALKSRFTQRAEHQDYSSEIESRVISELNVDDVDTSGDFEDLEKVGILDTTAPDISPDKPHSAIDYSVERRNNENRKMELMLQYDHDADILVSAEVSDGKLDWHDQQKAKIAKQLELNKHILSEMDVTSKAKIEGYRPGSYVRLQIDNVPCEFIANFNGRYPIVIGGILPTEESFGFVQVRLKKHRWHRKILKSNDPLIFSIGWRRFQTIPIYSISDNRTRNRLLKYTPEHMHCYATFYGPLTAPNTGFCAFRSVSAKAESGAFRVAATGVVLDVSQTSDIVKKLKLTGSPYKIYKNTAFIRDMFTSSLEVAKFEGANIRTVSGIRGQVKKALQKPEGHFRATFEDKVLMSGLCPDISKIS